MNPGFGPVPSPYGSMMQPGYGAVPPGVGYGQVPPQPMGMEFWRATIPASF